VSRAASPLRVGRGSAVHHDRALPTAFNARALSLQCHKIYGTPNRSQHRPDWANDVA
jgi:hypothetical protein